MKLTEKEFYEKVENILIKYSPWLQEGVSYGIRLDKFDEYCNKMMQEIMDLDSVVDDKTKINVADKTRKKLADFISKHNK